MTQTKTRYRVVYIDGATRRERANDIHYPSQTMAHCEALDAIAHVHKAYPGAMIEYRIEQVKR